MKRWRWHRTRVLLLAGLLGLGMSLTLVQGDMMATEMAIAADDAHPRPSGCGGCGGGDHNSMNATTCLAICGLASQVLISVELLTLPSAARTGFQVAQRLRNGQFHSPDHGPPKILTHG